MKLPEPGYVYVLFNRSVAEAGSIRASLQLAQIWLTDEAALHTSDVRRWLEGAANRGSSVDWLTAANMEQLIAEVEATAVAS